MDRFAMKNLWVAIGLVLPGLVCAAPTGGVVESGSASIAQNGSVTHVDQSTQAAAIGWDQFNVAVDETVTFAVPGANSVTLNTIRDQLPSQILGQVTSNGRVILANPNGLFFGSNSTVNVGSLIATTSDASLVGDQLRLHGSPEGSGIDHRGVVSSSGVVAFYSPHIDISGTVSSDADIRVSNHTQGTITFTESGIGFDVTDASEQSLKQQGIDVSGALRSDGGYVGLETAAVDSLYNAALNMEGIVSADSLVSDGGRVELSATQGTAVVSGDVSANSAQQVGGDIRIAGQVVALVNQGSLSAEGAKGGGRIDFGGGWDYTAGPDIAKKAYLGAESQVSANATNNGDGGDIWIWSDEQTTAAGGLTATGVGTDGDGGFVETSSNGQLLVTTTPSVGSESGDGGTWLLDPHSIYIVENVPDPTPGNDAGSLDFGSCGSTNWFCSNLEYVGVEEAYVPVPQTTDNLIGRIEAAFLEALLDAGGSITLKTTQDDPASEIRLLTDLNIGNTATGSLSLVTSGVIRLNGSVVSETNNFSLNLVAGVSVNTPTFGTVDVTVGDLYFDTPTFNDNANTTIQADSVAYNGDLNWRLFTDTTLSSGSLNSSSSGNLTFTSTSSCFFGCPTLTLADLGDAANPLGDVAFDTLSDNQVLDVVIAGNNVYADSLSLNASNLSITSTNDLAILTSQVTTASDVTWEANDDLSIGSADQSSVIQNDFRLSFDMNGNDLSLDSVSDSTAINSVPVAGSLLTLEDVGTLTINGGLIKQESLSIDAGSVLSTSDLSLDQVSDTKLSDGLNWTANGDLAFGASSALNGLTSNADFSFDLTGNDLTLGTVGQPSASNSVGTFEVDNVAMLTLNGAITANESGLNFSSATVDTIQLNADSALTAAGNVLLNSLSAGPTATNPDLEIYSNGGRVAVQTLTDIGSLVIDSRNSGDGTRGDVSSAGAISSSGSVTIDGNDIEVQAVSAADDITITGSETVTAAGNIRSTGGGITISANQLNIDNGNDSTVTTVFTSDTDSIRLFAPVGSASPGMNANLTLQADSLLSLQDVGQANALGALRLELADGSSVTMNGTAIAVGSLFVDATSMVMSDDTTITSAGNVDFTTTSINGSSPTEAPALSISSGSQVSLNSVALGGLTVDAASLVLSDSISVSDGDINFENADQITLSADTELDAGTQGNLLLSDNIEGTFDLTLSIDEGDLQLGSQTGAVQSLGSLVVQDDSTIGTNSTTGGIVVDSLLDLSGLGTLSVLDDAVFESATGDITLAGTALSMPDYSLEVAAPLGQITLDTIEADSLVVTGSDTLLRGDITATNRLDLSQSGDITLENDLRLTGPLQLIGSAASASINGNYSLTIDAIQQNLTLSSMGDIIALDSLEVVNAGVLQLAGGLNTQGVGGLSFSGSRFNLSADTVLNTSGSNGTIDLSGIGVNGEFVLTLYAGNGDVLIGDVGQDQVLTSLVLEEATELSLSGDITTADTLLDFSTAESIVLIDDASIDVSASNGAFSAEDTSVDGTYALSISTGTGAVNLGDIGQNVSLQSLSVNSASDVELTHNISVVDGLSLTTNLLTLGSELTSSGGRIDIETASGIDQSVAGTLRAYEGISMTADTGDINLGTSFSRVGDIRVEATAGSVFNTLDDFVSVSDTSINLTANNVTLLAGQKVGLGVSEPIVLDVPEEGTIDISLTAPTAYIVNINQSNVTSNNTVFDLLGESKRASQTATSNSDISSDPGYWTTALSAPEPGSELFAIIQPGYILAANASDEGRLISSDLPAVPNIRLQDNEWWLLYTRDPG